jgi:cell division protein FtsZ
MTNSNQVSENVAEDSSINEMEKSFTQEAIETSEENTETESIEEDASNDLKEFGVDSDSPDLFQFRERTFYC